MIGVIYARYSSESQRDESIDGQLRECIYYNTFIVLSQYYKRLTIKLIACISAKCFADENLSGSTDSSIGTACIF